MKIKLITPRGENPAYIGIIKNELTQIGHEVIKDDGMILYEGRKLDVSALYKIEQRDPRNNMLPFLRKEVMLINMEYIKESDCVLFAFSLFPLGFIDILIELVFAYGSGKPIYILQNKWLIPSIFTDKLVLLSATFCDENFNKICSQKEQRKEIIKSVMPKTFVDPTRKLKRIQLK